MTELITFPAMVFGQRKWRGFVSGGLWFSARSPLAQIQSITYSAKPRLDDFSCAWLSSFLMGKVFQSQRET